MPNKVRQDNQYDSPSLLTPLAHCYAYMHCLTYSSLSFHFFLYFFRRLYIILCILLLFLFMYIFYLYLAVLIFLWGDVRFNSLLLAIIFLVILMVLLKNHPDSLILPANLVSLRLNYPKCMYLLRVVLIQFNHLYL